MERTTVVLLTSALILGTALPAAAAPMLGLFAAPGVPAAAVTCRGSGSFSYDPPLTHETGRGSLAGGVTGKCLTTDLLAGNPKCEPEGPECRFAINITAAPGHVTYQGNCAEAVVAGRVLVGVNGREPVELDGRGRLVGGTSLTAAFTIADLFEAFAAEASSVAVPDGACDVRESAVHLAEGQVVFLGLPERLTQWIEEVL